MIILDTNVLSELMKPQPDKSVIHWIGKYKQLAYLSLPGLKLKFSMV